MCLFFKKKTAYEVRISDWSSDVCSSDLGMYASKSLCMLGMDKELVGKTVIPMPAATICRMVSSDEPSKVRAMPSLAAEYRDNSGQTSRTWSRRPGAPRVGTGYVSTCRSRWSLDHNKQK